MTFVDEMKTAAILRTLRDAATLWAQGYASSMGAALAYYTLFSLAPALLIVTAIAGAVFGDAAARGEIVGQIGRVTGPETAHAVEQMIADAGASRSGKFAAAGALLLMAVGATSVVGELRSALDRLWRVPRAEVRTGLKAQLGGRLVALGVVLAMGAVLIASLAAGTVVDVLSRVFGSLPGGTWLVRLIHLGASLALLSATFTLVLRWVPSIRIAWRDAFTGAMATAVLFALGNHLIALYLSRMAAASVFGAAGSMVALLVWIFYSAQIFLYGAAFTHVHAQRRQRALKNGAISSR